MVKARAWIFVLGTVICGIVSAIAAQPARTPVPVRIDIKTSWLGLGADSQNEFTIQNEKRQYLRDGRRIDEETVGALVAAMQQPDLPLPDPANLGITREWLEQRARTLPQELAATNPAANQVALYRRTITNFNLVSGLIKPSRTRMSFRTDDYPHVLVTIKFDDGTVATAETGSQHPFLVPWKVNFGGHTTQTYNADISRAVSRLMPAGATNRNRLAGAGLDTEIEDQIADLIMDDWNTLDAENRAGDAISLLRTEYHVEKAGINPYNQVEYGKPWDAVKPQEWNLHVFLHRPGLPENFTDAVVLLYQNGQAHGADDFLQNSGRYEQLALSVPWLSQYIREHPALSVRLSFVHDASFGDRAMQVFAADMHVLEKNQLLAEIRAKQKQIALLVIGDQYQPSYWLVLPDGCVVLWRYGRTTSLLKWTPAALNVHDCANLSEGGCVGGVVSAQGDLMN